MLITISVKYDPAKNPKIDAWLKQREAKGENVSEFLRRAIEADYDQERIIQTADGDRQKLQDEIGKLWAEVERLKVGASSRPQPEQAEIIQVEKMVEKVAEEQEIKVNVGMLKNRYFNGGE